MLRNRFSFLLVFGVIYISFAATPVIALPPASEIYIRVMQNPYPTSPALRLQSILRALDIKLAFPENGGSLSLQCAAQSQTELSPNTFLIVFKESLVSVLTRLQQRDGSVGVDSLLFVQLAAMLLDGKGNDVEFNLMKGQTSCLDLTLLSDRTFRHVAPEHKDVKRLNLNGRLPFRSSEIWLLDTGDDTWTGMTRSGPQSLLLGAWEATARSDIEAECQERLMSDDKLRALALQVAIKTGRFDKWITDI